MNFHLKVFVLTKYGKKGASSRLRSIQYFKYLEHSSIHITHSSLFDDNYLENLYNGKKINKYYVIRKYFQRLIVLFSSRKYDLLWIEKELFPWLPFNIEGLLSKLGVRYIVDYDDAIFHTYDQHRLGLVRFFLSNKIPNVMKNATLVTVCNNYLKDKAIISGAKNISIIPTVVDLNNYNVPICQDNEKLVIGWIGTPKTEKYIIELYDVFERVSEKIDIKVIVIGGKNFHSQKFENEILPWSEEKEVEFINKLDIGIMPLKDSKWEKGKCGYKLIQYMACEKPVIASAVGMNCEIVENDKNGYLVNTNDEWIESILSLKNLHRRKIMGKYARELVEKKYSLQSTLNKRILSIKENIK